MVDLRQSFKETERALDQSGGLPDSASSAATFTLARIGDQNSRSTSSLDLGATPFREFELRYIMPLSRLETVLDFTSLTPKVIEQFYFPRRKLPYLSHLVAEILELPFSDLSKVKLSSARIRKTATLSPSGAMQDLEYTLDIKGPKEFGIDAFEGRAEYSVNIDNKRYESLKPAADRGCMLKKRYSLTGEATNTVRGKRNIHPASLEIDVLIHAGFERREKSPLSERHNFVAFDIEVGSSEALRLVNDGRHSFSHITDCATPFSELPTLLQSALGTRRMAKAGLDDKALKALRKLRSDWGE